MTDTVQTLLRQRAQESCPATPRGEGLARDARHADCQIVLSDTAHLPLLEGLDLGGARVLDVGGAEWKELVSSADPDTAPFRGDAAVRPVHAHLHLPHQRGSRRRSA